MKIITANIGRDGMTAARVTEDFYRIKRQFGAKFIGFQEIDEADPADEHSLLRHVFKGYKIAAFRHMEPIVGPRLARIIHQETVKVADGVGGATPDRYLSTVVWQYRGKKFVHINAHFTAFAWNGKNETIASRGFTQQQVLQAWTDEAEALKAKIKHYNDLGYTVFWTGDVNRVDMPKMHPRERQLVTSGIDSISVIEGEWKVRVKKKGHFALNSDHDARWVSFDLVK